MSADSVAATSALPSTPSFRRVVVAATVMFTALLSIMALIGIERRPMRDLS